MNVIDRRAYRPNCIFCFDAGCPVCENEAAGMLSARLKEEELRELQQDTVAFLNAHAGAVTNGSPAIMLPRSVEALANLVLAAIQYGIDRERNASQPAEVNAATDRFKHLEIEP